MISPLPQEVSPASRDGGENFIAGGDILVAGKSRYPWTLRGAASAQTASWSVTACKNWKHGVEATSLKKATPQFASVSVPTKSLPIGAGQAREGNRGIAPIRRGVYHDSRGGRNHFADRGVMVTQSRIERYRGTWFDSKRSACNSSMSVPAPAKRCQRDDAGHGKPDASARGAVTVWWRKSRGGHATYSTNRKDRYENRTMLLEIPRREGVPIRLRN